MIYNKCVVWCGKVLRSVAWRDVARRGVALRGMAWRGVAWSIGALRGFPWIIGALRRVSRVSDSSSPKKRGNATRNGIRLEESRILSYSLLLIYSFFNRHQSSKQKQAVVAVVAVVSTLNWLIQALNWPIAV